MKERAYAKINLCLDVVGKRDDGYHELKMIMVPVNFYDVLEMIPSDRMTMEMNHNFLPTNEKNTVVKAIRVMQREYHIQTEFECHLNKHIPTRAGLAGGSADAAAAIRIMNRMFHLYMSDEELIRVGKEVGADVPFCIFNKPAYVEGIGEKLTLFENRTDFELLLVKPRLGVSTKEAFEIIDQKQPPHPDCMAMKESLENNDYEKVVQSLGNSLEDASLLLVKEIREVKEQLDAFGFDGVLMSGSGSTVFGMTKNADLVAKAMHFFKNKGYFVRQTKIL